MSEIFFNGSIITMEEDHGEAAVRNAPEAVLVEKGKIKAVGKLEDLKKIGGKKVKLRDLKGKCLMPSFIDPHSHIVMNGQMSMFAKLDDCESFQDVIDTLNQYRKEKEIAQNGVILGFGYDHNFLKEQAHPDKRVLDQVSTEIPIMILHVSAHLACVNSKALELAGVTAETKDPEGGVIGRLEDGKEPSGYLEEAGMNIVQNVMKKRMKPDIKAMVQGMQENYIQNGITTIQDGATTASDFGILKMMSAMKQLKADVIAYPLMSNGGETLLHENQNRVRKYKGHLKIGGYKLVLDGSPQGRSAWMSEPYIGDEKDYCAYPWLKDEQVEQYVRTAVKEKQQLLAHCNGDAASEQYLNAYEKVLENENDKEDLRPVMIHCQTVRNDQLDRMAKMKMIASIFVGHVYYWGDVHLKNFGQIRGHHISPVRDAIDRGIVVNFHQDTPVTKPNMMHSVWAAVNRTSRSGQVIGENQKISVYEALKAITINGAYQYFEENEKGTITVGKRADLVILEQSPLEVDEEEIRNINVFATIKDGKTIYCKEEGFF